MTAAEVAVDRESAERSWAEEQFHPPHPPHFIFIFCYFFDLYFLRQACLDVISPMVGGMASEVVVGPPLTY